MRTTERTRWMLVLLFIAAVAIAYALCELKWRSLNFHTRDFPFYLQFAVQGLDLTAPPSLSLNPHGHNWLLYQGVEAVTGPHQAIHLEPVKYIYALLYRITGTPRALFLFTSLVTFLPLLFLARSPKGTSSAGGASPVALALLYLAAPTTFYTPAFDLRPFLFLAPLFFLLFISIHQQGPWWQVLLWSNLLHVAREEAIVLNACMIVFAFAAYHGSGRIRLLKGMTICLAGWTMITMLYYQWTGYTSRLGTVLPWIIASACVAYPISVMSITGLRQSFNRGPRSELLAFGFVLAPLAVQFIMREADHLLAPGRAWFGKVLYSPRYALYDVVVIGMLVLTFTRPAVERHRKVLRALAFAVIGGFTMLNLITLTGKFRVCLEDLAFTREVRSAHGSIDPVSSAILTDFSTFQAFADRRQVFIYERLPWDLAGEARRYPANLSLLNQLIRERIDHVIVSRKAYAVLEPLLLQSGIRSEPMFANERFIGVRLVRG